MKSPGTLSGLFIIGLLIQCGLAENKRTQRQAYLPPHANNAEEYITVREEHSNGGGNFQESNFGDSKYQIFEVHSHYEPSTSSNGQQYSQTGVAPTSSGVSAPHQAISQHRSQLSAPNEEIIRVQHIHINANPISSQQLQQNNFKGQDYLPPLSENNVVSIPQTEYHGPDYLPPHTAINNQHHQHQQVEIQTVDLRSQQHHHGNLQQQQTGFSGPDYLPPHQSVNHIQNQDYSGQQVVSQTEQFRGPDYLPPHHEAQFVNQQGQQNQFKGPDYHQQHQSIHQDQYKGPDYLPPHQEGHTQHQHSHQDQYKGPDYLPPHQEGLTQHQHSHQDQYKGPDYLPPHQQGHTQHQHSHQDQYKGPDYLPPHQDGHTQHQHSHQDQYKGPDYLPPHQDGHTQHDHSHQNQFKGPDYLPPHHESHQQNQHSQQNQFKGPDYLPPHQEAHQQHQHSHQVQFKGPDYLPPHQGVHQQHQHNHQNQYKGPDYLPPHQGTHQQHQQISPNQFKGPDYLPPHPQSNGPIAGTLPSGYDYSNPAEVQAPQQQAIQQPLPRTQQLPIGYDFKKPENSEQAIAELHTLPNEGHHEVVVQSQIQVAQSDQGERIQYGQQQSGVNYQLNGYLPPENGVQQSTSTNYQVQQGNVQTLATSSGSQQYQESLQQVAPQSFGPAPVVESAPQPSPASLPRQARPVQAEQFSSNLHSLSSYMTTVKPFERYGNAQFTSPRQPFREYGPPQNNGAFTGANSVFQHQQQQQLQQFQSVQQLPVAPMYREQASRSPYYAPAMSYASNAVSNIFKSSAASLSHSQSSGFSQKTRHNLQHLMPTDVQHFNNGPAPASGYAPAVVPAPQPTVAVTKSSVPVQQSSSGKIRTVQIVNKTTVKTLKVLETSDHAGVKTIKILGHSNTNPVGDHHLIKVVTQNGHNSQEHVQTVKIFNDHAEAPRTVGASNTYLPPQVRVIRQSPLKLQLVSNSKHRRSFTGRRRYRA